MRPRPACRPPLVALALLGALVACTGAPPPPIHVPACPPRPPVDATPCPATVPPSVAPRAPSRPILVRVPRADGFAGADLGPSEVRRRVAQSGRPGLLFFCTSTCGFCDRMERETLSRPEVAARLATGFVAVRYDVDLPQGRRISQAFRLPGCPTIVVVDATGTEIGRIVGFRDAAALLAELAAWP